MQERSVTERVEILERKVETLEVLPARVTDVELQLIQLRDEMRDGFSAIRTELGADIRGGDEETRRVLREEIRAGDEETRQVLRQEIRAGDEETRRYMRVLHEEVVSRLATIQEGRGTPKKKHN